MKKKLLLVLLLSLFSISIVKADMGMPTFETVEAIVTEDGVIKDPNGKTIPKGEKIEVTKIGDKIYYGPMEIMKLTVII